MENSALFKQIKLSKPWSDPVNSALLSQMTQQAYSHRNRFDLFSKQPVNQVDLKFCQTILR
jgi:hypothetical protein